MIRGRNARNKRANKEFPSEMAPPMRSTPKKDTGREAAMERARKAREAEKSQSYRGKEKDILRDSEGEAVLSGFGETIKTGGMDEDMMGYKKGGKVKGYGCAKRGVKKCKIR